MNVDARLQINGGAFDTLGFIAEGRDRSVIQIYDASIFEGVILFADSRLLYANRNTDFPRQPGDIRAAGHSVARIIEGDSSGWFVAKKKWFFTQFRGKPGGF
ncbi:MAG: hypothetical protein SGJ19_08050 [Planctomycetia bacterium]|nr:hypothetical protein [Planctomycetia bacterium]